VTSSRNKRFLSQLSCKKRSICKKKKKNENKRRSREGRAEKQEEEGEARKISYRRETDDKISGSKFALIQFLNKFK
jgi:hypothetical protein